MKRQLEMLSRKPDFLEDAFESLPMGVLLLDAEGRVLMMNHRQEQISRVTRDEIIGCYFHERWKRLFDQDTYGNKYWELLYEGKPFTIIFSEVLPQFYDIKVSGLSHGAPLSSGQGFILVHDLSEELGVGKRALEQLANQLAESTEFLSSLIDSSPNTVITTDESGFIRSSNRTAQGDFGYSKGEFFWKHISEIFADPSKVSEHLSNANKGARFEAKCKRKNGNIFPVSVLVSDIIRKRDRRRLKLFLLYDITKEKEMEERLALSEELAIYSELMAGIAHQLNNPLVGVVNFSSLLLDKVNSDDANRKLVDAIYQAAKECQRLLASMVKSIKEPESTFHDVNIGEVLESAIQSAWEQEGINSSKVLVKKKIRANIPTVKGDSLQLHEVFRNIIINALQAMPDGGTLEIGLKSGREHEMKIWFRDTGHGISKQDLFRIFTPFFSTKKTGSGLGLSFAHQVVKSHSGRIIVRSSPHKGSTFIVVLPIGIKEDNVG